MPQNFLEIENVTFAASDKNKVNNVTLSIENEGDIVCLLGPSGIGKTTILRTIAGLEKIQSGKISLKNKTISPSFSILNETLLTLFLSLAANVTFSISKKFFSIKINR